MPCCAISTYNVLLLLSLLKQVQVGYPPDQVVVATAVASGTWVRTYENILLSLFPNDCFNYHVYDGLILFCLT